MSATLLWTWVYLPTCHFQIRLTWMSAGCPWSFQLVFTSIPLTMQWPLFFIILWQKGNMNIKNTNSNTKEVVMSIFQIKVDFC